MGGVVVRRGVVPTSGENWRFAKSAEGVDRILDDDALWFKGIEGLSGS